MKQQGELVDRYSNLDLASLTSPIDVTQLELMLKESGYDRGKTKYLIQGFKNGFDIGYRGPTNRKDMSSNIPIRIGSKLEMWNKIMKEVKNKCYAGPFEEIPFESYMQSPIGLVPKDGSKQTRLIFHLSYNFKSGNRSLNYYTPDELCSVSYNDLDHVVSNCLWLLKQLPKKSRIFFGKTDIRSAFRLIPLLPSQYRWLVMKAEDPETGKTYYFMDKCLPFGASISCMIFQAFSNALSHILRTKMQSPMCLTNYLDDFLFIAYTKLLCDQMVASFLEICQKINCPIAEEKTEWGNTQVIFLGILLDGEHLILAIPNEKKVK